MSHPAIAYALIAAAANVAGAAAVTSRQRWSLPALEVLIALSAGFMVSVAVLDLIPEALAQHGRRGALIILLGYLLVHLTQHTFAKHFHFGEEVHRVTSVVSTSALVGLLLHTFVDGVAIASSFEAKTALGILVFVAILLHKFPEGLAISSLFLAAGSTRGRALAAGAALGIATVVGAVVTEYVQTLATYGLALAAGVALYVGASNLVPEFQRSTGWRLPISFFVGCALYYLARNAVGLAL